VVASSATCQQSLSRLCRDVAPVLRLRGGTGDAGGARAPAAEPRAEAARRSALAQQDAEVALVRTRPPYPHVDLWRSGKAHVRAGVLDMILASASSWGEHLK